MTGLLIKDWKLLKNQGRFFLFMLVIAVTVILAGPEGYSNFMTSYMTFVFSIFVLSTLSYDSYDNGMAFLMSLPVSRKTYVREKYVFGLLMVFSSWMITVSLRLAVYSVRFSQAEAWELFPADLVYLVIVLIFIGYSLPVRMRYGSEKGQMISFAVLGVLAFTFVGLVRSDQGRILLSSFQSDFAVPPKWIGGVLLLCCALFWGISYRISVGIMEKKEF